jgi:diaminohydroxyphosphoribosylaminopyrimidine deaminase / 5-amino-6-(5-phosphoribosylamino)uracil reductase
MSVKKDIFYMRLALDEARKGYGRTRTNPLVGALVVKNNTIISCGYHAHFGAPHAEAKALKKAGVRARGATVYVTLEPCSTYGKTPPCTEAIIKAGIKRVVIAGIDPNPVHRNRGIRILRRNGITVSLGVLRKEAECMNRFFTTVMTKKRPFVTLKLAQSLDGKIATHQGDSKWITGSESRRYVHRIRNAVDGILVGTNTVRQDDPFLTVRGLKNPRQPARIVLDRNGVLPLSKNVFKNAACEQVILCHTGAFSQKKKAGYHKKNIQLVSCALRKGKIDIARLLKKMIAFDIGTVLIEGGSEVAAAALEQKVVDEVLFFIAPVIIGGRQAVSSVAGSGAVSIDKAIRISDLTYSHFGRDILVRGFPVYT